MSTKKVLIATLITVAGAGAWFGNYISVQKAQKLEAADKLAWCDRIYHQNVGCPQHGMVEIPTSVLAEQEADHLAWCDRIYHQNVGCPQHGMEVPLIVLEKQEKDRLEWCNRISHRNVSCPLYRSNSLVPFIKGEISL